jgi:multiple sugar transport system substrate-binding protein
MRKKNGPVLLLVMMVVLAGWCIVSCGSPAQPQEGVLDVWATWADGSDELQALVDRYSQSTGVPVQVTTRLRSDDLQEALAAGQPPDLVLLSNGDLIGSYAATGLLAALDPWIESSGIDLHDIYPAALAGCQSPDGATLCLPWGADVEALFWNKDLFAAAGLDPNRPPQTLEELIEYAHRLTAFDEDGELLQAGFVPDLGRSHTDLYVRLFGGAVYGDHGTRLTLDTQPLIDALNWQMQVTALYAPAGLEEFVSSFDRYAGSRHPRYAGRRLDCQQCHRSAPIRSDRLPDSAFYQGRVAMMVSGQWQLSPGGLATAEHRPHYGLAPLPPPAAHPDRAGTTVVQGPVLIVPTGSLDKAAAVRLLAWLTSPEVVADAADSASMLPTNRTAARDRRFQEPNLQLFLDLLAGPNARPSLTSPASPDVNQALSQLEESLLLKGGDPRSLLAERQAELAPKLEEAAAHGDAP